MTKANDKIIFQTGYEQAQKEVLKKIKKLGNTEIANVNGVSLKVNCLKEYKKLIKSLGEKE